MLNLTNQELVKFIESEIVIPFYTSRQKSLANKTLTSLIQTKNPYLFRVKNPSVVGDFVKQMLDAYLSSSEETIFGKSLEKLAVHVCKLQFEGYKPKEGEFPSVDLVFEKDYTLYIISIKSGKVWGNADSIRKMLENILAVSKALKTKAHKKIELVNGVCYGKSEISTVQEINQRLVYKKYSGKAFWELISGDQDFYRSIVVPIGEAIKGRDISFKEMYDSRLNELTEEMFQIFTVNGQINWQKIIQTNNQI
jgi:hypothetical protein